MKKIVFDISTYNVYTVYPNRCCKRISINAIQWKTMEFEKQTSASKMFALFFFSI